jgi:hypothetical protein
MVLRSGVGFKMGVPAIGREFEGLVIWGRVRDAVTYLSWPFLLDVPWRLGRCSMRWKFEARASGKTVHSDWLCHVLLLVMELAVVPRA